jgi:UDP-N-acetylmuramate--alanine ligase
VDIYATREQAEDAFAQFARQTERGVVAGVDDAGVRGLLERSSLSGTRFVEYGLQPNRGWQASRIVVAGGRSVFDVLYAGEQRLRASIGVPGRHNVQNALAAAAGVLEVLGADVQPEAVWDALGRFQGAARRFELKGEAGGVPVVDDYAHNPAKVRAALQAARERYPDRRIVAYFQPHTFSRTQALVDDFAASFGDAEVLLIGDIYPSRESADDFPGVDAWYLTQRILDTGAIASGNVEASARALLQLLQPGDVLITLGAGDGYLVGELVLRELGAKETR